MGEEGVIDNTPLIDHYSSGEVFVNESFKRTGKLTSAYNSILCMIMIINNLYFVSQKCFCIEKIIVTRSCYFLLTTSTSTLPCTSSAII